MIWTLLIIYTELKKKTMKILSDIDSIRCIFMSKYYLFNFNNGSRVNASRHVTAAVSEKIIKK
jgi:hypothetical protein